MTTNTKRELMLSWAAMSRKVRHSLRATCSVIELDAAGHVISARHVWL
jgi:hypothetical protein